MVMVSSWCHWFTSSCGRKSTALNDDGLVSLRSSSLKSSALNGDGLVSMRSSSLKSSDLNGDGLFDEHAAARDISPVDCR